MKIGTSGELWRRGLITNSFNTNSFNYTNKDKNKNEESSFTATTTATNFPVMIEHVITRYNTARCNNDNDNLTGMQLFQ